MVCCLSDFECHCFASVGTHLKAIWYSMRSFDCNMHVLTLLWNGQLRIIYHVNHTDTYSSSVLSAVWVCQRKLFWCSENTKKHLGLEFLNGVEGSRGGVLVAFMNDYENTKCSGVFSRSGVILMIMWCCMDCRLPLQVLMSACSLVLTTMPWHRRVGLCYCKPIQAQSSPSTTVSYVYLAI